MELKKLKIIIIDDEKDIRNILVETINESYDMIVIGEADSVNSGYEIIVNNDADAVFLDIKLRGGDAFQILHRLKRNGIHIPAIIINTGFDDFEYAQKSHNEFREEVIMILKKPFWDNWRQKEDEIIKRIFIYKKKLSPDTFSQKNFQIRTDNITHIVRFDDIILIETGMKNKGTGKNTMFCKNKSFTIYKSLRIIDNELPSNFVRISRFAIININYLENINNTDQTVHLQGINNREIGYSELYKEKFLTKLK
jgi:two-component system LytT family response regulator